MLLSSVQKQCNLLNSEAVKEQGFILLMSKIRPHPQPFSPGEKGAKNLVLSPQGSCGVHTSPKTLTIKGLSFLSSCTTLVCDTLRDSLLPRCASSRRVGVRERSRRA
jgi:hypothetical protein